MLYRRFVLIAGIGGLFVSPMTPVSEAHAQQLLAVAEPPPPRPEPPMTSTPAEPLGPLLPALHVVNGNTNGEALIRIYDANRMLDKSGLAAFRAVAGDVDKPAPLHDRVIQLVFKAAYELGARKIVLVSSFRPKDRRGRGGYHTTGDAVDFRLVGVGARKVAAHARHFARAGVGIYTHPDTQYVHVDARDESFHWIDASPPGRTWKERQLGDGDRETRDAAYRPDDDLPSPSPAKQ